MRKTINQTRDDLIDSACAGGANLGELRELKQWSRKMEEEAREDPDTYKLCPRCRGYHTIHGNFDDLCDKCVSVILKDFPDHPSVPFIKEALKKW